MSWKPFSSTVGSIESSDKSSLTLGEKLEKWKRRREMVVYLPRSPPYDMLTKRLLFGIFFLDKPKNPFARSISNLLLDDFMPIYGCKSWTCHRLKKRLDICDDFEMPNKFITVQQHGFWMEFAIVTFCKKKYPVACNLIYIMLCFSVFLGLGPSPIRFVYVYSAVILCFQNKVGYVFHLETGCQGNLFRVCRVHFPATLC